MTRQLRTLLLTVLMVMMTAPAMAQLQDERHNFAIGVNTGLNMSSVSFEPSIKQGNLMGMEFGFTARYVSEKYFKMICGVQAELNFSQRGWKESYDDDTNDAYKRVMNYVEIPLMAHIAFGKDHGKGARFVLNLGPQVGFMLSEKEKISEGFNTEAHPYGKEGQYGKMAENKFDYGLIGGGGVELRTGVGNFLLEGRYYFGLSDIFNSTKKDFFSRSAHSYIGVRLSYLFDLKK